MNVTCACSFAIVLAEIIKQRPPFEEYYLTPVQASHSAFSVADQIASAGALHSSNLNSETCIRKATSNCMMNDGWRLDALTCMMKF